MLLDHLWYQFDKITIRILTLVKTSRIYPNHSNLLVHSYEARDNLDSSFGKESRCIGSFVEGFKYLDP